ncbi:F-box/LRR-repeat protein [Trifolium repens]|nr:F-box/LRR-repeat protein [Trifolium repens]
MKRKRKITPSSFKSSSSQQMVTSYSLPDECWESIFRFIIDDNHKHNRHYLNSLSVVSKQFLSITNRLLFSLTIYDDQSTSCCLFKRFTNINSLKLRGNIDILLLQLSRLPLKLTSLNISYIPANALRTFSQKITTLTSLTCCKINLVSSNDLFLIAECFPLLKELDLSYSLNCQKNYSSGLDDGIKALSVALIKLCKVNLSGIPINNQLLFHLFNNCKLLKEVTLFSCDEITYAGLALALRERPTLRSLSFSTTEVSEVFPTSQFIDSLVCLKGLTCLVLHYLNISNELLYSIASEGLPLTRLDLQSCNDYSYRGIFCLLYKCQRIQHLNLQYVYFLNDQQVIRLSGFLGDLVSINLSGCKKLTYSTLFGLVRNCPLLSEIKMERIGSESDIVGNYDSLGKFDVYTQLNSLYLGRNSWLSDEIVIIVTSIFPNLQLLDLEYCNDISEGICQVLRKCCKIRHLNLANCPNMKLHGLNFVVPKLEVLNLSNTKVDDETLDLISKNCCGLSRLFLRRCKGVTKKAVKHVLENRTQLRVFMEGGLHLSDKNWKLSFRYSYNRR